MDLHGQAERKGTMLSKPVVLLDLVADTTPPMSTGQTSKKGNLLAPFSCTPMRVKCKDLFLKPQWELFVRLASLSFSCRQVFVLPRNRMEFGSIRDFRG